LKLSINKIYFLKQFLAKFFCKINITNFKKSLLCLRVLRKSFYKIIKLKFTKNTKNTKQQVKFIENIKQQNKNITKLTKLTNKISKLKKKSNIKKH